MKKLTAILLSLMMLVCLAGCNAKNAETTTTTTVAATEKGHQSDAEKARGYYYYEGIFLDTDEVKKAFLQAEPGFQAGDDPQRPLRHRSDGAHRRVCQRHGLQR